MIEPRNKKSVLQDNGERLLPTAIDPCVAEHLHRYAIAQQWCLSKDVLDIASGEGYGSSFLARRARSVVGVDLEPTAVDHAIQTYRAFNLSYRQGSATSLPFKDASFDVVVSFETVEHLGDQDRMLVELKRVLRPGGLMIMSTPDKRHYPDRRQFSHSELPTNHFHVKELTLDEFQVLIARYFTSVSMLYQRLVYGSLVTSDSGSNGGYVEFKGDFLNLQTTPHIAEPVFLIALATDGILPDDARQVSFFDGWPILAESEQRVRRLLSSPSVRLGRLATWPFRKLVGRS